MGARSIDYDIDFKARKNLLSIIEEESRHLYPTEVSWFLSMALSQVYALVPRAKTLDSSVRFDARIIKSLKRDGQITLDSSLKTEKKAKNAALVNRSTRERRVKADLCL